MLEKRFIFLACWEGLGAGESKGGTHFSPVKTIRCERGTRRFAAVVAMAEFAVDGGAREGVGYLAAQAGSRGCGGTGGTRGRHCMELVLKHICSWWFIKR